MTIDTTFFFSLRTWISNAKVDQELGLGNTVDRRPTSMVGMRVHTFLQLLLLLSLGGWSSRLDGD